MDKDRKFLAVGSGLSAAAVGAFGLARLSAYPPHEDETLALFVGRDSFPGLLDTVLTERGGAPLHYVLAWVVVHLGGGLDALRLVSLACALASIPLIAALASRLVGQRALYATVLACASWAFLFHALFGRMYALFLLTATASFLALVTRRWAWWSAATLAAVAAHPYGALLLAAQLAYLLLSRARPALPWAALVLGGAAPLWYAYWVLAGRYGEGEGPKSAGGYLREVSGDLSSGYLPVLLGVVALAVLGFARVRARLLVGCGLGAALLAFALAAVTDASPESRHLIFLLPLVATLVAAGLPSRAALAVPLAAVLVVFELAWAWHRTPELFEGESATAEQARADAAEWLAETARPDDVLHGYHPVFLAAWQRDRSFPRRVVPRADAKLALEELAGAPPGRGVWVVDGGTAPRTLESRRFGPLTVVRSRTETGSAAGYLAEAETVLSGIDLETVREARRRYERFSRAPLSKRSTASR
jgi:hypothetical protein